MLSLQHKILTSLLAVLFIVIVSSPIAYSGVAVSIEPSMNVAVTRSPLYYIRRVPLLTFPVSLMVSTVSQKKKGRSLGDILVKGWILFGVTSFLITTVGVFNVTHVSVTYVYLGSYVVASILSVVSLGYLIKHKLSKGRNRKHGTNQQTENSFI